MLLDPHALYSFQEEDVETLSELLKWTMQEWDSFDKLPTMAKLLIKQELSDVKSQKAGEQSKASQLTQSEKSSSIHKVR